MSPYLTPLSRIPEPDPLSPRDLEDYRASADARLRQRDEQRIADYEERLNGDFSERADYFPLP